MPPTSPHVSRAADRSPAERVRLPILLLVAGVLLAAVAVWAPAAEQRASSERTLRADPLRPADADRDARPGDGRARLPPHRRPALPRAVRPRSRRLRRRRARGAARGRRRRRDLGPRRGVRPDRVRLAARGGRRGRARPAPRRGDDHVHRPAAQGPHGPLPRLERRAHQGRRRPPPGCARALRGPAGRRDPSPRRRGDRDRLGRRRPPAPSRRRGSSASPAATRPSSASSPRRCR